MAERGGTWILVADGARARVFRLHADKSNLTPAWEYQLVGSNRASRAIASDRPGRTFDRGGKGRHAKEPPTDPARHEKWRFAQEIVRRLDGERKRRSFEELIVVAPPPALGDLRAALPTGLERCVTLTINKDLSKLKPAEIVQHLSDVLQP